MQRRPLVVGNWKMNGTDARTRELVSGIVSGLASEDVDVVVCPPHVFLAAAAGVLRGGPVALGAQNVSEFGPGARTGEIAAEMLVDVGCRYVIVGHSERRHGLGESDDTVAAKARAAIDVGLTPIVCVGELLDERRAGTTHDVIARQLAPFDTAILDHAVVAYEPVWAIGTGETATPDEAQDVHAFIRSSVGAGTAAALRLLYGGSVKPDNAKSLFDQPDIDGGLIGGASLDTADFLGICAAARP